MKKSPYPGFTKLNKRRLSLLMRSDPLSQEEEQELHMLNEVCRLMIQFRWPKYDIHEDFDSKVL